MRSRARRHLLGVVPAAASWLRLASYAGAAAVVTRNGNLRGATGFRTLFSAASPPQREPRHRTAPRGGRASWTRVPDPTGAHDGCIRVPYTFPPATLDELTTRLTRAWADWQRHGAIAQRPPVV
jgi:hypothetical protein